MSGIESLLIGRTLGGRYRIEEVIGRGGMGAVYRAVDERLGRQVALKVITVGGAGDAEARERLRARFFREARSAAALPHHPNVVPVYDYGSDEELGLDYLVMELLRGADLATRLARSGVLPLSAALKILIEAARGLAVGHRQGLIHRDVKPGNVFLTETHSQDVQVRVVDFGIAKLADDDDTLAQLTQDGRVPHSPAYASPEQLRGLTQLTTASDVFSLGALGFQLLTGERPFTESDRNRMSLGMPVDIPSVRSRNPAVPASVDTVIRRALAFDAEQRYADAGEMGSELERAMRSMGDAPLDPYIGGAAIVTAADDDDDRTRIAEVEEDDRTLLAPPPPPFERPREVRAPAAAGAVPPERRPLPPRAEPPPRRGVGGMLVWALVLGLLAAAGIWGWSELQRTPRFSLELPPPPDTMPDLAEDVALETPSEPTLLDAVINNQEGIRYFRAGQYDSALVQFQRAVQIDPNDPDYRRNYGLTLAQLRLFDEAEQELGRAIQLDASRPLAYRNLAEVQLARGDTATAIGTYEEYLTRETDNVQRGIVERRVRDLRAAQQPAPPPLLGEPVGADPGPVAPGPAPSPANPGDGAG